MNSNSDEYDENDENDEDHNIYESEETSTTKYNIIICHCKTNLVFERHKIYDKNTINNAINYFRDNNLNTTCEIAECIYLETHECVAIKKTFWLRLIQRVWKRICREREEIFNKRKQLKAIRHREISGTWPEGYQNLPTLRGMLAHK